MCDEIISEVEVLIRSMNAYVDEGKEKQGNEDFLEHFQNIEASIIEIAKSIADYRSFCGTNPHLLNVKAAEDP